MKMRMAGVLLAAGFLVGCGSGSGGGGGNSGDEGAKGGDMVAQQAALIINDVITQVGGMPEVFPEVNQKELAAAASRVHILVREKTYANGVETDAVNNGYDTIQFNISRWKRASIYERKMAILAHELFGLIGVEPSANYNVSRRIFIEGRFNSNRLYECFGHNEGEAKSVRCTMRWHFNGDRHSFTMVDLNCEYPGIDGFAHSYDFNYVDGRVYSTHDRCSYPDESGDGEMGSCSRSAGSGTEFDTVEFEPGFNFQFTGVVTRYNHAQVGCRAL
jgi:hypothetical protein